MSQRKGAYPPEFRQQMVDLVRVCLANQHEQGQMLQMPAIFPNQDYALAQIDELRRLVSMHFAQAAQVGAQVIAAQQAAQAQNAPASSAATQESTAS